MLGHTFIDRGTDRTLVLLHGIASDRTQLRRLWDLPYSILAVDLFSGGGDIGRVRAALEELLSSRGIERFVLVGYSLGGYVAQYLLADGMRPEAVVLIATGVRLPHERIRRNLQALHTTAPERSRRAIARLISWYRYWRGEPEAPRPKDVEATLAFLRALEKRDFRDELRGLSVPTLVLQGSDDWVVPPELARPLAKAIPHARYVEWKTDHSTVVEDPRAATLVEEFLSSAP